MDAGGINDDVLSNIGLGNDYKLSECGESNGYEQNGYGKELGRLQNPSEAERHNGMGEVGHLQSQAQNTPHTKRVHRSGVSAEVVTSSGLTAEQIQIKNQNLIEGVNTEYFIRAKNRKGYKDKPFVTKNTTYYPNAVFERNNITIKNGIASFTEKRFNDLVEEFSVPDGGQLNQNYAKGYVAYISPSDFLSLTTPNERRIVEEAKGYGNIDIKMLSKNSQTLQLIIDFASGTVVGHEGRHRMALLRQAGINKVAILIRPNSEANKYNASKYENLAVTGQDYDDRGVSPGVVTFDEIIPLSPNYRNEAREKFVDNEDADVRYSLDSAETDTAELTPERQKEIFEQFEKDRAGVPKPSKISQWGERAAWVAHNMTRVFPNIPERGERGTFFAEFRKSMIQWKNLSATAYVF